MINSFVLSIFPTLHETMLIFPELILTLFACTALILDIVLPRDKKYLVAYFSLAGIAFTAVSLWESYLGSSIKIPQVAFYGMISIDGFSLVFRMIFLVAAALSVALSVKFLDTEQEQHGEYYSLILFATVGMMFMACGADLLSLYISLELMALSVYVLVGYLKRSKKSNEAAIKYFLMGAFSSGILLYGISLIYGVTGTTNLQQISIQLAQQISTPLSGSDSRPLILIGTLLLGTGLLFKIAAVPFHMWAPDAYEGAPTSVTAFMSIGPKAASYALLARVFLFGLEPVRTLDKLPGWAMILGIVAALTMTVGNLSAVTQTNTKRLLAYSSISHAGYVLLGIVAGNELGYIGVVIYLLIYTIMNAGTFGILLTLRRQNIIGDQIDDLNGLFVKSPVLAVVMLIFLLSLAGIPMTAGFIGKYYLFGSLVQANNKWMNYLAVLAVLNTAISFYYYAKLIRAMFTSSLTEKAPLSLSTSLRLSLAIAVVLVILIGVYPTPFIKLSKVATHSIPVYTQTISTE